MDILVAGGTGFIGSAIVKELLRIPGYQVAVLSRRPENAVHLFGEAIRPLKGDVTDIHSLPPSTREFDCVIQCVQFPNHPVQDPSRGFTYEKFDAIGTENVMARLQGSKVKRVIYLSGAGTRAGREEPWFKAKLRAEAAVKNSGISYVILRPSWIYGPNDRSMNRFIEFARKLPFMPVIGDGLARVAPLFIDDLAKVVSKSVESEVAKNRVIELGGPEILTMNDLQKTVLEVMEKKKPLLHQPIFLAKAAGFVASHVMKNPPLSAEAVDFITMDVPTESRSAEELFKMKFVDLKTALGSYVKK